MQNRTAIFINDLFFDGDPTHKKQKKKNTKNEKSIITKKYNIKTCNLT